MRENDEETISAIAAWLTSNPQTVAAITLPHSRTTAVVLEAIQRAEYEPVAVSMRGTEGVDLVSAAKSPIAVTFRPKVIVVFEFDAIVAGDPGLLSSVKQAIAIGKTPVILVWASFRTKGAELPKGHVTFAFPETREMDVRAVFADSPDRLDDKGLSGAMAAFSGQRLDFRGDGIAYGAVFDNYPLNVDMDACVAVSEAFSTEDAITEGMRRAGCFDDVYTFFPIETTSVHAHAAAPHIDTFGKLWSQANAMAAKAKTARHLRLKTHDGLDGMRTLLGAHVAAGQFQEAAAMAKSMGYDASDVLSIMRLWKTKYTLSTHAKLKKAF